MQRFTGGSPVGRKTSSTELNGVDVEDYSDQQVVESQPREISLVPIGSTFSDDFSGHCLRPSVTFRKPLAREDSGTLKQLRSLRSTLTAAMDSFKSGREAEAALEEAENLHRIRSFKDPGNVWVRGCACEVIASAACFIKADWSQACCRNPQRTLC